MVNIARDEMTNEHATTALCMNELRGCQKFSMGPNFIYFGTQKYGYRLAWVCQSSLLFISYFFRPIPSEIVTEELDKLIAVLEAMSNDTTLLKKWYRKDTNKVWIFLKWQFLSNVTKGASRIHFASYLYSLATFSKQKDAQTPGQGLWSVVGNPGQAPVDAKKSITGWLFLTSI